MSTNWTAIVLTGGTSRRFGSDKSQALLSNYSLLDEILLALPVGLPVIVVGPEPPNPVRSVQITREQPIYGGPVAGVAAGLEIVETDLIGVIATDMPFVAPILSQLIEQLSEGFDAAIPIDATGFRQPLSAAYRVTSLRKALLTLGNPHGQSMRNLVALLKVHELLVGDNVVNNLMDIDTQSDLSNAIAFQKRMRDVHS